MLQDVAGISAISWSVRYDVQRESQLCSGRAASTPVLLLHRWNTTTDPAQPYVVATFDGHTDWVNDVTLLSQDVIATASADCVIRLWSPDGIPMYQVRP